MTREGNRLRKSFSPSLSMRYELEPAADELAVQDFESVLGLKSVPKSLPARFLSTQPGPFGNQSLFEHGTT